MSGNDGVHDRGAGVPLPGAVAALIAGYSRRLAFRLNGQPVEIADPDPAVLLSDYLRDSGLTGTKVGCGEGGCGACTVMIGRAPPGRPVRHQRVPAPLAAVADSHVTTVEGIGSVQDGLDPVQDRIAAVQRLAVRVLHPRLRDECACFPPQTSGPDASKRSKTSSAAISAAARATGRSCTRCGRSPATTIPPPTRPRAARPTRRPVAGAARPPGRSRSTACRPRDVPQGLYFHRRGRCTGSAPPRLAEAHELKALLARHFGADERPRLVFGNTARAIYPGEQATCLIDVSRVPELGPPPKLRAGAAASGASVADPGACSICWPNVIARRPAPGPPGCGELRRHAGLLAGYQVRMPGSVGGNIAIAKGHRCRASPSRPTC